MSTTQELKNFDQNVTTSQADPQPLRVRPAVDLVENEGGYLMYVEMPGVDHSTVDVSIERNVISIRGQADFAGPAEYRSITGDAGPRLYERSFQLSDEIDRDSIDAEVRNGVLALKFAKAQHARRTSITVKGA